MATDPRRYERALPADALEHEDLTEPKTKRVLLYGWDSDDLTNPKTKIKVNSSGELMLSSLVPEKYDYIELSYTGSDLTGVVYKTGGASGTTVATLTLGYTDSKLTSVERT